MTLEFPWPPVALNPNARVHWSVKQRAARAYRHTCWALALLSKVRVEPGVEILAIALTFRPPADGRRRDDDNMIAAFKAGRDGLADALRVDDGIFRATYAIAAPLGRGSVTVEVL